MTGKLFSTLDLPGSPAIYTITNKLTAERYVGAATNVASRRSCHACNLSRQRHSSKSMQASFDQHGKDAFEFAVIELCQVESLAEREEFWIASLKPVFNSRGTSKGRKPGTGRYSIPISVAVSEEIRRAIDEWGARNRAANQSDALRMIISRATGVRA